MKRSVLPARRFRLPALPREATRCLEFLGQTLLEPERLVGLVGSDPGWASQVLRQARAPIWALPEPPETLSEAIGLLGLRRFQQVVVCSAVRPLLWAPLAAYGLAAGELWEHSVRTALVTREILVELGQRPCEEAFLAAILHDVGKLVLGSLLESEPDLSFAAAEPDELEAAEQRLAGMGHAEAGGLLLEHWGFPHWLVEAVRQNHDALPSSFLIADLVHLADRLTHFAGAGGTQGLGPELSRHWNLSRGTLERIAECSFRFPIDIPEPRKGGKER